MTTKLYWLLVIDAFSSFLSQRCLRRLQDGRSRLVDKFRGVGADQSDNGNLVKEVMEVEWDALRQEKNECISLDSMRYNPFEMAAQVLLNHRCCKHGCC